MKPALTLDLPAEAQPLVNAIHVQQLRLAHVACGVAVELYKTARVLWPDHPEYPPIFQDAPPYIQRKFYALADEAVAKVNPANEQEAERQAEQAFLRCLKDAEQHAFLMDEDHSRADLIRAAFGRLVASMLKDKPVRIVLSIHRAALQKGGQ